MRNNKNKKNYNEKYEIVLHIPHFNAQWSMGRSSRKSSSKEESGQRTRTEVEVGIGVVAGVSVGTSAEAGAGVEIDQ